MELSAKNATKRPRKKNSDSSASEDAMQSTVAVKSPIIATHPRIRRLLVRNFRCIGERGVDVTLDEIVVLVGANNTGKSTVLRAYEIALRSGEKSAELEIEDFPYHKEPPADAEHLWPEIILETVVTEDTKPAEKWILTDTDNKESYVKERWRWRQPGKASHVAFNKEIGNWAENEEQKIPWGFDGVAKPKRPEPLRLSPFDSPEKTAETLTKILRNSMRDRVSQSNTSSLTQLVELHTQLVQDASIEAATVLSAMTKVFSRVFPDQSIRFDPPHEATVTQQILDFLPTIVPKLCAGSAGHFSPFEKLGSGAQRMIMWAALRSTAEQKQFTKSKELGLSKSYLLLIDEPELCLHPNAVREACKVLFDIARLSNWQVMITTHSPVFIDLSANNTSIVRVDRDNNSKTISYAGTTIYRPASAELDNDDRDNLTMLTACDPYVSEFFFAKRIIVVEGDTEYVALQTTINKIQSEAFNDVHIIRARGKACIPAICKILNQFQKPYSVLHDSDKPTTKNGDTNGRWTDNGIIRSTASSRAIVVAMIPNFEMAILRDDSCSDNGKPYEAYKVLSQRSGAESLARMQALLNALLGDSAEMPSDCISWATLTELETCYDKVMATQLRKPTLFD